MDKDTEKELKDTLIHAMKELGEIAEVLVKMDRPEHWKEELADLCAHGIKPMLKLAGMEFNYAVELGTIRKLKKMREQEKRKDSIDSVNKPTIKGEENMSDSLEKKYLVLKWEDIEKLPEYMINDLHSITSQVKENRKKEGKIPMLKLIDVACYE